MPLAMTLELKISILAAIAALGSAYWAWSSARIAKRALAISEEDAATRKESLNAYLINALRWDHDSDGYISFSCSYTNRSSNPTTVERIELVIHGFAIDGNGSSVRVNPEASTPKDSSFTPLNLPLNLPARTTCAGWLNFKIPKSWIGRFNVDKYELVATTWSGQKVTLDSHIVMKQGASE